MLFLKEVRWQIPKKGKKARGDTGDKWIHDIWYMILL